LQIFKSDQAQIHESVKTHISSFTAIQRRCKCVF